MSNASAITSICVWFPHVCVCAPVVPVCVCVCLRVNAIIMAQATFVLHTLRHIS